MDIYCVKCGEPLDMSELHDVPGMTYKQALSAYRASGCGSIGFDCNPDSSSDIAFASSIAFDLMGDDIDGVASMMDDARMFGFM